MSCKLKIRAIVVLQLTVVQGMSEYIILNLTMFSCEISVQSTSINFLNICIGSAMKELQFFACKVTAKFFHHCLAFQIIMVINFCILNSFDANNLIRSSFMEFSFNVLVFFTAGGQSDLVGFFFSQ